MQVTKAEFADVVFEYQRLIYTICYQLVRDTQLAEDLTQETFITAYTHIESCELKTIKPWLARIATNKAKDYLKSAYNKKVYLEQNQIDENPQQDIHIDINSPELLTIQSEGANKIRDEIYLLKEPYLQVSIMFFLQEKPINEISIALKRPEKTVYTQLYRAKNILKQKLKTEVT